MIQDVFSVLQERGFIAQTTDEDAIRDMLKNSRIVMYNGYDSTADSLHVGHLVTIMAMMHLQQAGHTPIGLVGGGTTMIGDPSERTELRQMLSEETIRTYGKTIHKQLNHYLKFHEGQAIAVNNADWLLNLNYLAFLRDIGRHFSVNRMLSAEGYKQRWERGLNFIELNYQILQAYDYLVLHRRYNCVLQLGGDDQWSNLLAGVDLVRRVEGATVQAMTYPLLTTSSGAKMGKTAAGAIWLDPNKFSPYDYYQYWVNCDDKDVAKLLKIFTMLPMDEIDRLAALQGAEVRDAKRVLAFEATKITHGEAEAQSAAGAAQAAFSNGGNLDALPTTAVAADKLAAGIGLLEALTSVGLTKSNGEGRRLVKQGGVYVNETRIDQPQTTLLPSDLVEGAIMLRTGKKKYHRLVLKEA